MPPKLRRELAAIAAKEQMMVGDLVRTVLEEFVTFYRRPDTGEPSAPEEFEIVWRPGRDDSLVGPRESKSSLYDGDVMQTAKGAQRRARS